MNEVTRILSAIEEGDPHAAEQLLPLVYDELRKLAAQKLAQDEALDRLTQLDPAAGQLVKLCYFAGLSVEQAAEALAVSRSNAYRLWTFARAWLRCQLTGDRPEPGC